MCILQWQNFYIHLNLPRKGPFWSSWNGKLVFSLSFFPKTSLSQLSLKSRSCPLSVIIDYMFRNNKVAVLGVNSLKKLSWLTKPSHWVASPYACQARRVRVWGWKPARTSEEAWAAAELGSHSDWHPALPADPAVQFFYLIKLQSQRSSWNTQVMSGWVF